MCVCVCVCVCVCMCVCAFVDPGRPAKHTRKNPHTGRHTPTQRLTHTDSSLPWTHTNFSLSCVMSRSSRSLPGTNACFSAASVYLSETLEDWKQRMSSSASVVALRCSSTSDSCATRECKCSFAQHRTNITSMYSCTSTKSKLSRCECGKASALFINESR